MILITLCVLITQKKSVDKIYFFMKGHNNILQVYYLFLYIYSTFTKKSQGAKYGDKNLHVFEVTPYIIFTHPVSLCFSIMTSIGYKLSRNI